MNVAIELPEDIVRQLEQKWGDLRTRGRSAIAIEGYRTGALSQAQLQQVLGLSSQWETDAVLKQAGVYLDYTETDLSRDIETSRKIRSK